MAEVRVMLVDDHLERSARQQGEDIIARDMRFSLRDMATRVYMPSYPGQRSNRNR
jgi:hypothetical protein